ncbi:DnaB-like helicase N-terminal domain-containing protein [Streptomyces silvisoli]|uniref:DnaB-like helicase N-terminal domain-containing protein n=1 Tax=Streptomyces silvisoli TaxID=3034235 RepID=A0ABT5ZRX5_9ACTN|nr:DnaB-like helicase N-terminal domain-containing protein [Streptomyces silvisoli]MDF3292386.1 DnaB-like helicase N-terminal domain-containing protein [Streptomyces silvisoli]
MPHPIHPYEDDDLDDLPTPPPVHYAEQSLLGALLLDPHQLAALTALEAGHFSNHTHGALFAAMRTVPPPDPETHRTNPAWLITVLDAARPEAPGLTASYLHTLTQVCPWPKHAATYARMIRADHARRMLRMHAERLAQTATDPTLPNPAAATLTQADTLGRFLEELSGQFAPHPSSLPRTVLPETPPRDSGEEALEEERLLLATATAHPADLKDMRWLLPEDFTLPLHAALWQCLTSLVHRGDPVDPINVLWEAQHRGLLADAITPNDLMALISTPVGSPEHWGEKVLQRALLTRAHTIATRITTYTEDPTNTPHQLITGSRRALADLTALRTRWQPTTTQSTATRTARTPATSRAGPPPRTTAPAARSHR